MTPIVLNALGGVNAANPAAERMHERVGGDSSRRQICYLCEQNISRDVISVRRLRRGMDQDCRQQRGFQVMGTVRYGT